MTVVASVVRVFVAQGYANAAATTIATASTTGATTKHILQ